jgi:A/G-specific adenine glycosylase
MPWKNETDPYRIWLSEIILQQTRVEQGIGYYEKFISAFPTIRHLAVAQEKEIFKYWEGLGYYNRCRNLIATAKKIVNEYRGQFPSSYDDIRALPGVGPYTAAAIASFAYGLPYPVVDGNVERVFSRYFGIDALPGTAAGKRLFQSIAVELLDKGNPAAYNQAIMDFGATICKPRNPLCTQCVQVKNCQAFQNGWVQDLPKKRIPLTRNKRWFYYFIIEDDKSKIWIHKRTQKDIWQNLYEFVLCETGKIIPQAELPDLAFLKKQFGKKAIQIKHISPVYCQKLTHQVINCSFIRLKTTLAVLPGFQSVSPKQLRVFPFPKLIADYIETGSKH